MSTFESLESLSSALAQAVPELAWQPRWGRVMRGTLGMGRYRLCLGHRGRFGCLLCRGQLDNDPRELLDLNSRLHGPLRVALNNGSNAGHLNASWPSRLAPDEVAPLLANDLRRLATPDQDQSFRFTQQVIERLKRTVASRDAFVEVPTTGGSYDFIVGRDSAALQIAAWKPSESTLSLSTLVTNWRALAEDTRRATAMLMLMLNARLRWVRLMRRGTAIEAHVAIPADAITLNVWLLAWRALSQAVASSRQALRLIQVPAVTQAFEELHGKRPGAKKAVSASNMRDPR